MQFSVTTSRCLANFYIELEQFYCPPSAAFTCVCNSKSDHSKLASLASGGKGPASLFQTPETYGGHQRLASCRYVTKDTFYLTSQLSMRSYCDTISECVNYYPWRGSLPAWLSAVSRSGGVRMSWSSCNVSLSVDV